MSATGWTLSATVFNWTPDIIRAERQATEVALDVVRSGIAEVVEVELGQLWRSFPRLAAAELRAFRAELEAAGGRVSIAGASIDDWSSPTRRRTDDERFGFLLLQVRAAAELGARGIRLPIGQAGGDLLRLLLPVLGDLDVTLFEEVQGPQHPAAVAPAIDAIAGLDDPRVRLLVDTSLLMPSLPASYLEALARARIPGSLLDALTHHWRDPATADAVVCYLRSGQVPPEVRTLYMNLLVRFGRSTVDDLRPVLPLIGAFHLKLWDLDDTDGRVSAPVRALGPLLRETGFTGTLCSEWGGHEWLDEDASDVTRRHLALAREALKGGSAPPPPAPSRYSGRTEIAGV